MTMTSVITLSSSSDDDDDGDVQIIGEKRSVKNPIKEEYFVKKCSKVTDANINASDDSDDEIICLDSEDVIKKVQTNGSGTKLVIPKKEHVPVPSDDGQVVKENSDRNGNLRKKVDDSCLSDVILIDSEEESDDQKSSGSAEKGEGSDISDDDIQMLDADDLSNVCYAEGSSNEGSKNGSCNDVEKKKSSGTKTQPKKVPVPPSTSSSVDVKPSTSSSSKNQEIDEHSGPGNLTEKLLKQLNVKISQVGFSEENQSTVTKKIMKYYSSASGEFTQSQKFVDQVKNLISELSRLMALPNSKDVAVLKQITDKIKEFLGEFQRGSTQLTPKLNKLRRVLDKLHGRIQILETKDVDSDSEYENPYIMLDRYRKRAVQVYDKIRQLEGKSNHADRLYLQEFIYSGVGPVPVQRALEKYYNKTKSFPDFAEVYKLVKKVNTDKDLCLTPSQVHLTAQQVFVDFGKKLKTRREYDDFLIIRSYLPESQIADPADEDNDLRRKLDFNKKLRKTEAEVLAEFALKEASGEGASKDNENGEDEESSKSDEDEDSEVEKDELDKPKKTFMDSDEEMDYFGNVEERRRSEEGPVAKKTRFEKSSSADPESPAKELENGVEPATDRTDRSPES